MSPLCICLQLIHLASERRLKCDETRPHCKVCIASRRACRGYRDIALAVLVSEPTSETLWHDTPAPAIAKIGIRPLEQLQMLSNVVEYYSPSNRIEYREARNGSFLGLLPAMDLSSPIVGNAIDSLCFAHFATQSNDLSLLLASQASYGKTIHALTVQLANPGRRDRSHRATCYGIMVISLYGAPKITEQNPQNDWEMHYWGVHQYLQSVGPSALDLQNEFDFRLFINLRGPLLFLALARRRSLVLAQLAWLRAQRLAHREELIPAATTIWFEISARLPGSLEYADQVLSSYRGGDISQLLKAFCLIDNICQQLIDWVIVQDATCRPQRVTVQDPSAFDMEIEEHAFIVTSDEFDEFSAYKRASMNNLISLVWLFCVVGKCTQLRFFNFTEFSESQEAGLKKAIENQAYEHARSLCKMVFSVSKLGAVANAHYICVFLKFARSFFDEVGANGDSDWCRGCMHATRQRIQRIEKTEPPTVCRIASLGMSENLLLSHVRFRQNNAPLPNP